MNHMMIDTETLDVRPRAIVMSIGLVLFNEEKIHAEGHYVLNFEDQIRAGRTVSHDTILWWMQQGDKARASITCLPAIFTSAALNVVATAYRNYNSPKVWSNGAAFDVPVMESLFDDFEWKVPWHHGDVRCYRTVKAMAKDRGMEFPEFEGTRHNPLDDARHQAHTLQHIWRNTP